MHASQIPIANQIYSPTEQEKVEARKVAGAHEKSTQRQVGALRLDEKLMDALHYRRSKDFLKNMRRNLTF